MQQPPWVSASYTTSFDGLVTKQSDMIGSFGRRSCSASAPKPSSLFFWDLGVWTTVWPNGMPSLIAVALDVLLLFSWAVIDALPRPQSIHIWSCLLINCSQPFRYFSPCPFCLSNFLFYIGWHAQPCVEFRAGSPKLVGEKKYGA